MDKEGLQNYAKAANPGNSATQMLDLIKEVTTSDLFASQEKICARITVSPVGRKLIEWVMEKQFPVNSAHIGLHGIPFEIVDDQIIPFRYWNAKGQEIFP